MTARTNKTARFNLETLDRRDLPSASLMVGGFQTTYTTPVPDDGSAPVVVASQPTINRIVFGDGTSQRSMVNSIRVSLAEPVEFNSELVTLFQLHRSESSRSAGMNGDVELVASSDSEITTQLTLTFQGRLTETNGSLIDGFYDLSIDSSRASVVGDLDRQLDHGHEDEIHVTGSLANKWFRLAGDSNGDGQVNQRDVSAFRSAYGFGGSVFDLNGDGKTDQADYIALRDQYGARP